jgi:7,8-dihydropterin-6-yl-methyl-4-(beta-D-ribofuranosyl)aminobenzene 5'-phosphate synthase
LLNILDYARCNYLGKNRFHAVYGGLHLAPTSSCAGATICGATLQVSGDGGQVLTSPDDAAATDTENPYQKEWEIEQELEELVGQLAKFDIQYTACNQCTGIKVVQKMMERRLLILRGTSIFGSKKKDLFFSPSDYVELFALGDHMGNEVLTKSKKYRPLYSTDGFYKRRDETDCEGSCFTGECTCKDKDKGADARNGRQ